MSLFAPQHIETPICDFCEFTSGARIVIHPKSLVFRIMKLRKWFEYDLYFSLCVLPQFSNFIANPGVFTLASINNQIKPVHDANKIAKPIQMFFVAVSVFHTVQTRAKCYVYSGHSTTNVTL